MARFQFLINNTIIEDEPIGWDEAKLKIVRSKKYRGLFVQYIGNLTFYGDGYDLINTVIETDGFCGEVLITIRKSCGDGTITDFFEGRVNLGEIKHDIQNCQITANIEDNLLSRLLSERGDVNVRLDATKSISGTISISIITRALLLHDYNTGAYSISRYGYRVGDIFDFIVDYISDGEISFTSDFFQTDTVSRVTGTIVFTNPTVDLDSDFGAGDIDIVYEDYFGNQHTVTTVKKSTVLATLNDLLFRFNSTAGLVNELEEYYDKDYTRFALVTHNNTDTITLVNDLPFKIISVTGAAVTAASLFESSLPDNGMIYLSLLTGGQLRDASSTVIPELSFDDLFAEMNKHFDLGIRLTRTATGPELEILPLSELIQSTQAIELENVDGLSYSVSRDFMKDLVKVGQGGDKTDRVKGLNGEKDWVAAGTCTSEKIDLRSKFNSDWQDINIQKALVGDDKNDDKIYLLECDVNNTRAYENRFYTNTSGTSVSAYAMNAHLTNYWKVTNWLLNINGDINNETRTITNDKAPDLKRLFDFNYALTGTQIDDLIANNTQFIRFNYIDGWIDEVEININTNETKFKLITA